MLYATLFDLTAQSCTSCSIHRNLKKELTDRAKEFHVHNISYFDSLHMAVAEDADADVLLTTDDRLVRRAQNTNAGVRVANPVTWLMEVTSNE